MRPVEATVDPAVHDLAEAMVATGSFMSVRVATDAGAVKGKP